MPKFTVLDLIARYRKEATAHHSAGAALEAKANDLERDLARFEGRIDGQDAAFASYRPPPTLEAVRALVAERNVRIAQVAAYFGTTSETVYDLVRSPESGVFDRGRGWLALRPESPREQEA